MVLSKKRHYTKEPYNVIKKALNDQGYTHAVALAQITGQSVDKCRQILSGEIPVEGNGLPKISAKLGIEREKLL